MTKLLKGMLVLLCGVAGLQASELPNSNGHLQPKNQFNVADINLTQGTVEFSETDLRIPGVNGLDIVVSRRYNSRQYQSTSTLSLSSSKTFGPGFGYGWALNVVQRAFIVDVRDEDALGSPSSLLTNQLILPDGGVHEQDFFYDKDKIVIESGGVATTYDYDTDQNGFYSKVPGNKHKVTFTGSSIEMQTSNGLIYYYDQPIYEEFHNEGDELVLKITGYYLGKVEDSFGNSLVYSYDNLGIDAYKEWNEADQNSEKGVSRVIGMSTYDYIKGKYNNTDAESYYIKNTLMSIESDKGVSANFVWDGLKLSKLVYKDQNNNDTEISYSYNDGGRLKTVNQNGELLKEYVYQKHDTEFKLYHHNKDNCWSGCYKSSFYGYYESHRPRGEPEDQTYLDGYLLKSSTNHLGATVEYSYEETLEADGFEPKTTSPKVYHGTYPVVISKTVSSLSESDVFKQNIQYPEGDRGYIYNIKASYKPDYIDDDMKLYYFDKVTVKKTINGESFTKDEVHSFKNGLLTKKTQGDFETVSSWDTDKNLKEYDESYVAGQKRGRVEYSYDENRNISSINRYKGEAEEPYSVERKTYWDEESFDVPLLDHLVKKQIVEAEGSSRSKTYSYHPENGKLKTVSQETGANTEIETTYSYDEKGRPVLISSTTATNDKLEKHISYTEGEEDVVETSINGKTVTAKYNKYTGQLISKTDMNGHSSEYDYDDWGRPIKVSYANNQFKAYVYSDDFKSTTVLTGINGDGCDTNPEDENHCKRRVTQTMDSFGRTVTVDRPEGSLDTKYEYYVGSKLKSEYEGDVKTDDWERIKTLEYDSYVRATSSTDPDWGTTTVAYDDESNVVTNTDTKGRESRVYKNELGQTTDTEAIYSDGTHSQEYSYDDWGQRLSFTDPMGRQHQTDYNDYGQVETIYYASDTGYKSPWQEFAYYQNNSVKETIIKNESGSTFATYGYNYDKEGRLTEFKVNGGVEEYLSYDEGINGLGKLSIAENNDVKSEYEYDEMGRITKERTTIKALDIDPIEIATSYTGYGDVESVSYPDGKRISYDYDELSKLKTIKYENDAIIDYSYDEKDSKVSEIKLGTQMSIRYSYDDKDLVTGIEVTKADGSIIYEQSFDYDAIGQITQTNFLHAMRQNMMTREYGYTEQDQLESITIDGEFEPSYTYAYDKLNNPEEFSIAEESGPVVVQANYNIKNELLLQLFEDERYVECEYDAEGKMVSKTKYITENGQARAVKAHYYDYNYQGQIKQIQQDDEVIAKYAYNHKKERVHSKTYKDGKATDRWYYNNGAGQIIGEGTSEHEYAVRYIYNGNEKIAMLRPDKEGNEVLYYFINNMQGTPVMITDNKGNIVSRIQMDEWGNLGGFNIASRNEINFTGKKLDSNTGLYYFNQRYYDPELGRFLTHDPAKQTINPYVYAGNNPIIFIDPDGLWKIKIKIAGFGFSIGSDGISVSIPVLTLGVNFEDGSMYASVGVNLSSGMFVGDDESFWGVGYDLGIGLTHNFSSGETMSHMDLGAYAGGGGASYRQSLSYQKNVDSFADIFDITGGRTSVNDSGWEYDLDKMRREYIKQVGHDPDMGPGEGVGERGPDEAIIDGTNTWGNDPYKETTFSNALFVHVFPGREGGFFSRIANRIPGQNAFSHLHDIMSYNNPINFVPSVPFCQVITYGAYVRSKLPE